MSIRGMGRSGRRLWLYSLCLAALSSSPAAAHTQPYSFVDLRIEDTELVGTITAHIADLAHEAGLAHPEALLDLEPAETTAAALEQILGQRFHLRVEHQDLPLIWESGPQVDRGRRTITYHWRSHWAHRPGRIEVDCRLFPYDPQHETYLNIYESGRLCHQDLMRGSRREVTYFLDGARGRWAAIRTFLPAGIHHIFVGPDHILFLLGLLLLGGRLGRLFKIVSCFTIAHSVTLALATLQIVRPPARIVEPAIALSIIAVGLENLRAMNRSRDRRVWFAFFFGLVHGFGFAGVLEQFGLSRQALGVSLLAFNGGVEIGQACILAGLAAPLMLLRASHPKFDRLALAYGSLAVILAGSYWLIARTVFS
jgi:hydrogenase/urease accessory protein HupE